MTTFRWGVIAIVSIGLFAYFGFTKANPFANPYELQAVFDNVNNLKPRSPVRIAGVEVGKVKKVTPVAKGEGAAKVQMEIKKQGLPIHRDASLKVRQRIFLEGNFFVDLKPGTPSSPTLKSGGTIPVNQTAAPVQFSQVLAALQSDTREDLQIFLAEYSKATQGSGATGFNETLKYSEPAYKGSSLVNDATLGQEPTRDLQRVLRGQQRTFSALVRDEGALKSLVTNFNVTAGAFAREDVALEASISALRDTLRVGYPALGSLNNALPTLRAFSRDALPGVRSSSPTLTAALPFIRQARRLVSRTELRRTARLLRIYIPDLTELNDQAITVSKQGRTLSACTNNVLIPFLRTPVPADEPGNSGQRVRFQLQRQFVGLAGESRLSEGAGQSFRTMGVPNPLKVKPAPPSDIQRLPARRPDQPCEIQDPPNLAAPGGPVVALGGRQRQTRIDASKLKKAQKTFVKIDKLTAQAQREFRRDVRTEAGR